MTHSDVYSYDVSFSELSFLTVQIDKKAHTHTPHVCVGEKITEMIWLDSLSSARGPSVAAAKSWDLLSHDDGKGDLFICCLYN